jgi:hypothetical protein
MVAAPYKPATAVVYRRQEMTANSVDTLAERATVMPAETLDQAPKRRRRTLRDRIGERKRCYELPEETAHH